MDLNTILANRVNGTSVIMDGTEAAFWFPHMLLFLCGCGDCRERLATAGERAFTVALPVELMIRILM